MALACVVALGCGDDGGDPPDPDAGDPSDAAMRDGGGDGGEAPDGSADASGADGGTGACLLVAPPFDEGVSYERTLHVAADGSPDGDGTLAAPFDTIPAAAAVATPGTEIRVAAGTYGSFRVDDLTGEPERPIAIVAEPGVIIDGGGTDTGVSMSEAHYVVVQGLTIRNAGVHGMNLDDGGTFDTPAHHLVLRDIAVEGAGTGGNHDCIKMSGIDDFWLEGVSVSACDQGEGVDMVGCHRGLIRRAVVADVVRNGIQAKGGSADVTIHGSRFERIPGRAINAGGSTGLDFFRPIDAPHEAARIRAVANLFVDVGTESGAPIAFVGCDGCSFVNNTIVRPRTWVARILQESNDARFVPSRDGLFANNLIIVEVDQLSTFVNVGPDTAPETFTFANNAWWALDRDASWTGPTLSGGIAAETDSLVQSDPLVDASGADDYRPAAGSPLEGAGRSLPFETPDFVDRCFADPPSIGAYELAN